MLLETVDVKRNDVLIFSYNIFDLQENFRIIFKKDKIKRPYKISYEEVCDFISEQSAKNIIVYRLLTNISNLDVFGTKYGYFLRTKNGLELIYFDPIYAFKDLTNLNINLSDPKFRFKMQQVGFTTLHGSVVESEYREIFAWDMRAQEAQNQNDKVFADAIFMFDSSYQSDGKDFSIQDRERINREQDSKIFVDNLREEIKFRDTDTSIKKPGIHETELDEKELKKELLKRALGINTSTSKKEPEKNFSSFLDKYRKEVSTVNENAENYNGIFDESSGKKFRDESVILRFTSEKN